MKKNQMLVALLDEYWKVINEFHPILAGINEAAFVEIKDAETEDPDCRSIKTILQHMVRAGYGYSNYINQENGIERFEYRPDIKNPAQGKVELDQMMAFVEKSFEPIWHLSHEEIYKFSYKSSWGPTFNFEQLMEHAIVHISRHRRQIVNFLA